MDKQNIVVLYNVSSENKALFVEVLESYATLTFLNEMPPEQRTQTLQQANIVPKKLAFCCTHHLLCCIRTETIQAEQSCPVSNALRNNVQIRLTSHLEEVRE